MKDEEFVKLKHWLNAEFTVLHIFLAIIMAMIANNFWGWVVAIIYVLISIVYAAVRIQYVESKHMGYLDLPKK